MTSRVKFANVPLTEDAIFVYMAEVFENNYVAYSVDFLRQFIARQLADYKYRMRTLAHRRPKTHCVDGQIEIKQLDAWMQSYVKNYERSFTIKLVDLRRRIKKIL